MNTVGRHAPAGTRRLEMNQGSNIKKGRIANARKL